ncbi:MAG: DUF4974 domain-containing protein [Bacteroidales bacterium]|nr:DUF4974 domain-containing protein [Bacteroidales bacterium]
MQVQKFRTPRISVKKHRNLKLTGEAFFEVIKNDKQPFIVQANEARVKVTGTKFNVKAYKHQEDVKVTVTEGTVQVYDDGNAFSETIKAGETGILNKKNNDISKVNYANLNDMAWKTKVIDFNNTTLDEVARVLENTYYQKIDVDPAIQNCSVTVRFVNRDLKSVLLVLQSTLDLKIETKGKTFNCMEKVVKRCLIACLIFFSFFQAYAQSIDLDRKITVRYLNQDLSKVLAELTDQYRFRFSYNPRFVKPDIKITYEAEDKAARIALNEIFNQAGLSWMEVDGYIILKPGKKKTFRKKKNNRSIIHFTVRLPIRSPENF